jgi:uncharacterized protein YmfQ (DUF2313 family)
MPVGSYWPLSPPLVPPANPGYPAPALDEDDFVTDLADLFPPGRAWAWTRDPNSVGIGLLHGLALSQATTQARKNQLLIDAFPATTVELLPEWEASVGLPDPCSGPDASLAARQAHVVARIKNKGGQSIPYLVDYAFALGFVVTVTPFATLRFGSRFGTRFYDTAWATTIKVNTSTSFEVARFGSARFGDPFTSWGAAPTTIRPARFGASRFGARFSMWGNAVLECELRRVAPGHLYVLFAYFVTVSSLN